VTNPLLQRTSRMSADRRWVLVLALALIILLASAPAAAHKLKVFAAAEGARIQGSAYFAGGAAASGARVEVRDAQGQVLAELTPDQKGRFAYAATASMDHVIVALTGDGHHAYWMVTGAELAGALPAAAQPQVAPYPPPGPGPAPVATAPVPAAGLDPAALAACEAAVARQVRPLREELDAAQDRARLHDILGGIGYILGIAGLGHWLGTRRQGRPPASGA